MQEVLDFDPAAFGILAEEVVDSVFLILSWSRRRDVRELGIHRIDVFPAFVEEVQERINIGRRLLVKANEQVAVSKDHDVRLLEPNRHPDTIKVKRFHRFELRGSHKYDSSDHATSVLDAPAGGGY